MIHSVDLGRASNTRIDPVVSAVGVRVVITELNLMLDRPLIVMMHNFDFFDIPLLWPESLISLIDPAV